jgi:hypothetical protein
VVCHLHDEEREDFRARRHFTLLDHGRPWPPIHPAAWVSERRYMEQDFTRTLHGSRQERKRSLEWLSGLEQAPLINAYMHPRWGR